MEYNTLMLTFLMSSVIPSTGKTHIIYYFITSPQLVSAMQPILINVFFSVSGQTVTISRDECLFSTDGYIVLSCQARGLAAITWFNPDST